jgi:hypothetical protein
MIIGGILYKVYKVVNHHTIRIACCGKKWSASIDIDDTEPKDTEPKDTDPKDTEPKDTEPKDTNPEDADPERPIHKRREKLQQIKETVSARRIQAAYRKYALYKTNSRFAYSDMV